MRCLRNSTARREVGQWSKATFFNDYKTARAIIGTKDPSRQKFLSKHISGFVKQNWHDKRDDLIEELINCKFSQNRTLQLGEAISYDNYC